MRYVLIVQGEPYPYEGNNVWQLAAVAMDFIRKGRTVRLWVQHEAVSHLAVPAVY